MKEKKNIFKRVKDWWDNLAPEDRACAVGSVIGGFLSAVGACAIEQHIHRRDDEINAQIAEQASIEAYRRGLKDGEMRGYYNLLVNTDHAFKKMGIEDVKHF